MRLRTIARLEDFDVRNGITLSVDHLAGNGAQCSQLEGGNRDGILGDREEIGDDRLVAGLANDDPVG